MSAYEDMVREYERYVYSIAMREGLGHDDACDVTQIVFMEAWAHNQGEGIENPKAWLGLVARRQAWRVRSLVRRTIPVAQVYDPEENSEDPTEFWANAVSVMTALGEIDELSREFLLRRYFSTEATNAEIADSMQKAPGSIGPLHGRALAKLRNAMLA